MPTLYSATTLHISAVVDMAQRAPVTTIELLPVARRSSKSANATTRSCQFSSALRGVRLAGAAVYAPTVALLLGCALMEQPTREQSLHEKLQTVLNRASDDTPKARPTERQLAPGIYFTPAPVVEAPVADGQVRNVMELPDVHDMSRDQLEREYREIVKSVAKLHESCEEIEQFDPQGNDPDFVEAVRENKEVIAKKERRMQSVKARLDFLIRADTPTSTTGPNPGRGETVQTMGNQGYRDRTPETETSGGMHL